MRVLKTILLAWTFFLVAQKAHAQHSACDPRTTDEAISVYLDNQGTHVTATPSPANGTLLQFGACISYTPSVPKYKFYTGVVTIVYFDKAGHYLGSNGQILTENGQFISILAPVGHNFGAGIYLGYALNELSAVSEKVLIEAYILDCTTTEAGSCNQSAPHSFFTVLDTKSPTQASPDATAKSTQVERSCAHPKERAIQTEGDLTPAWMPDPDPGDALFRLYGEALVLVTDDPPTTEPRKTHFAVDACLRLVPRNEKMRERAYDAVATAYFFDKSGRVIGFAKGGQLAIGGQQLGILHAPVPEFIDPTIPNNFLSTKGPIHDFGVEVSAPFQDRYDIDSYVLIAVTVTCREEATGCADRAPHSYYKMVAACAPNLPQSDELRRERCPDFGHSTP